MGYQIIRVRGHYEVYLADGSFFCSADSLREAQEELLQL